MQWHVAAGDSRYVAESIEQLATWVQEGRIPWTAQVYHPRELHWIPLSNVAELRPVLPRERGDQSLASSFWLVGGSLGCIGGVVVLLTIVASLSRSGDRKPQPQTAAAPPDVVAVTAPAPDRVTEPSPTESADYRAGYATGRAEGADHARSGAGMPIPLGMNWMAERMAEGAHPTDAETWKSGFKSGFEAGFTSVTAFHRDDSQWDQLSWQNARAGVKLYDYSGNHEATIRRVDRDEGLIVVRYRSGNVEPKLLDAVAQYWWVRKR
jgi:hypothetical protein